MPQFIRFNYLLKKILPVICFLLCFQYSFTQTKYGIIAGAGKSSLSNFAIPPADYGAYAGTSSFWGGITVDVPVIANKLSFFTGITYNKKGYKYALQNDAGTSAALKDSSFTQKLNYIDLSLNLRKKFLFDEESINNFFVGTGPVISILSGGKELVQANYFGSSPAPVNITNSKLQTGSGAGMYKPVFFSWSFGAGLEFGMLAVSINANIPLADYFQDAKNAQPHKIKTFGVNVAYTLFTHIKKEKPEKEPKPSKPNPPVIVKDTLADTDGDGIADIHDKCPTVKGVAKYFGCPVPDTDGDGINDEEDQCITVKGTAANHGCPPKADTIKPAKNDTTRFIVYFEPGKSILRTEGFQTLSKVVELLKANPKLVAVFTGHTDNVGSEEANYNRSLLRANVCADYVASFYIDKKRLTIISMGNKMPAADLNDPLVQWKNRRVEISVYESK